jgi:hypothetical protein
MLTAGIHFPPDAGRTGKEDAMDRTVFTSRQHHVWNALNNVRVYRGLSAAWAADAVKLAANPTSCPYDISGARIWSERCAKDADHAFWQLRELIRSGSRS